MPFVSVCRQKENGLSTFTDVILNATIVFERFYTCYTSQGDCFAMNATELKMRAVAI